MKHVFFLKRLVLLAGDVIIFGAAFWSAQALRRLHIPSFADIERTALLFGVTIFLWLLVNYINGLYDLAISAKAKGFYRKRIETAATAFIVSILFFYLLADKTIAPKTILLLATVIGYTLSTVWHVVCSSLLLRGRLLTNVLFVGYTPESKELISILKNHPERSYITGAVIDPSLPKGEIDKSIPTYTALKAIRPAISTHQISFVVVSPEMQEQEEAMREIYELLFWPVQITDLTTFYETLTGRIPPSTFSEAWFLQHLRRKDKPVYENIRTIIDMAASITLFAVFALLFPILALLIKTTSKGPIFYKQKRTGLFGKPFFLYKFRSMYALGKDGSAETEGYKFATKNDERVTVVGKILRKMRLDELPQAINLMKRDITLIGPRPERPQIVEDLTEKMPYYPLRHVVRPGLLGWAILHQHYADTLEKSLVKLQYDLFYIKNRSLLMDISIILRTFNVVFRGLGQ
jgi:exopolysaccharide biosynthesis polyprenyl glycosylphosphotransferase